MDGQAPEIVDVGWGFTAVYALVGDGGIVLVDSHRPGNDEKIVRRMERSGLDPARVTALVVTHGHPDHAGSTAALAERLQVPVIASVADRPYLDAGTAPLHTTNFAGDLIATTVPRRFPPVTVDVWADPAAPLDVYGVHAEVRTVGGHTPGSVVVWLPSGEVIVGDLLRTRMNRRHTPARHWFQDDEDAALAAIDSLLDQGATTLYPVHRGALAADDVRQWLASDPAR
ncbi:MAG: MBL fold metallo-hydrolase [Myxococcota bacterium]